MGGNPPTRLFSLVGARALTDIPLQAHVVWMGEVRGRVYGVVTSPISFAIPVSDDTIRRHGFVSDIQRSFMSEEFVSLMGVEPVDLDQIFDELGTAELGSASVEVDGIPVPCCQVRYRGVEFVGGYDQLRWPFSLARPVADNGAWPALTVTTVAR